MPEETSATHSGNDHVRLVDTIRANSEANERSILVHTQPETVVQNRQLRKNPPVQIVGHANGPTAIELVLCSSLLGKVP